MVLGAGCGLHGGWLHNDQDLDVCPCHLAGAGYISTSIHVPGQLQTVSTLAVQVVYYDTTFSHIPRVYLIIHSS